LRPKERGHIRVDARRLEPEEGCARRRARRTTSPHTSPPGRRSDNNGTGSHCPELLREKKDQFDLVISNVHMPDMDGFKLLELVGLEMDLPGINS